jgi:hypothetical protein
LPAFWGYNEILLELQATLIHEEQRYIIPTYGGEGWGHVFLKIVVAAHLLTWGYPWKKLHWEQCPPGGPGNFRPDLYAKGQGCLPSFWFECGTTEDEKLRSVSAALSDFRIVHVMDANSFLSRWNGQNIAPLQIEDKRKLKQMVLQHRHQTAVLGVEYWGVRETSTSARILFAVRREKNGQVTYLDSGEGWSLSNLRYVSRGKDRFQALIPGRVGNDQWRGENSTLI